MNIQAINSLNNYPKIVSDYNSVRQKIMPKEKSVQFRNNNFEIKVQRQANDIAQFIIDANLKSSPKIDNKEPKKVDVIEKYDGHLALLRKAPLIDRIDYVIEKLKCGEYVSASTMAILSIVYGPEDLREVTSAYKQIKSLFSGKGLVEEYDCRKAQHPASFFRGSVLHKSLNPFSAKNVDLDKLSDFGKWWHKTVANMKIWLLEKDKALIDTKVGKIFVKDFDVGIKTHDTTIEEIAQNGIKKKTVKAYQFISNNKLAKLTARAMTRTPVIGTVADATIETLEIINDIKDGENFFESFAKAGVRLVSSTALTGYLGAIGSKAGPIGTLGSLTLATYINEKFEQAIE